MRHGKTQGNEAPLSQSSHADSRPRSLFNGILRAFSMSRITALFALTLLLCLYGRSVAGEWVLKKTEKAPPAELAASIRDVLKPTALQLMEGEKPVFEFWFRESLPLKSTPESPIRPYSAIGETALIGAVLVHAEGQRDYKDNQIFKGLYTMRYGLQPQDGDHLGTADYPYFAVLIPAKYDTALDSLAQYRPMVKASGKDTPTGHPTVLSLRPVLEEPSETPQINEPAPEHQSLIIRLPGEAPDGKAEVLLELVFEGETPLL